MKRIHISLIFLFCLFLTLSAQTATDLAQAKTDYKNKEFEKALPVFEREYNAKPTDASMALWYGVCLVETNGDNRKAEECLLTASKKNLPDSYLYLGDLYVKEYRLTEAAELYARYAKVRPKERETTLKGRNNTLEKMERLVSRTEDIQIIDSVIVDKQTFLSAYKLSADAGTLSYYQDAFNSSQPVESVVYKNGKGSKIYFGQSIEGRYVLSTMDKLLNGFSNEKLMSENNFGLSGNTNYPFVLTDGTTTYFAAEDANGIGGYDIYVTRYNLNTDTYLTPELLNMPFNSPANDYMMVVDETKGVGWFATDRFQPEGKVCIYTFIPNEEVAMLETDDDKYKESRARILSIKDSWQSGKDYNMLVNVARTDTPKAVGKVSDFTFVVDDMHVYHTLGDFKSTVARNLYAELREKEKSLSAIEKDLENKRTEYANASASKRNTLSGQILKMESQQSALYQEVVSLATKVRNEEIKSLK